MSKPAEQYTQAEKHGKILKKLDANFYKDGYFFKFIYYGYVFKEAEKEFKEAIEKRDHEVWIFLEGNGIIYYAKYDRIECKPLPGHFEIF